MTSIPRFPLAVRRGRGPIKRRFGLSRLHSVHLIFSFCSVGYRLDICPSSVQLRILATTCTPEIP